MTHSGSENPGRKRIVIEPEQPLSGRDYLGPQPDPKQAPPSHDGRSRRNRTLAIGAIVVAVFALVAFRSQGPSEQEQAAQAAAGECLTAYEDALQTLSELKSQTSVGLNYSEHDELVMDLTTESDLLENEDLGQDCATLVTGPLEEANALYIDVGAEWDECLNDFYCDTDYDFNPEGRWIEASEITDQIQSSLGLLEEISVGERDSGDYPLPAPADESGADGSVS